MQKKITIKKEMNSNPMGYINDILMYFQIMISIITPYEDKVFVE